MLPADQIKILQSICQPHLSGSLHSGPHIETSQRSWTETCHTAYLVFAFQDSIPPPMSSSYVLLLCPFCFYVEDLSLRIHLWHVAGRKPSRTPECLSGDKITGNHAPGPLDAHIWSCFWLWFGCRSASPYFLVSAFYFFICLRSFAQMLLGVL